MRAHKLPWQDALRILRKRQDFVSGLSDTTVADSIQAFLAWKALIIVARGTTPAANEKNQCQELFKVALADGELHPRARAFIRGLEALSRQSDALLQEWYCEEGLKPPEKRKKTDQVRYRIRKLVAARDSDSLADEYAAYNLGEDMYAVRSAVIAHASVLTTGNLFSKIVVPFGDLAALAACAGIADRATRPLTEVMEEAHVNA